MQKILSVIRKEISHLKRDRRSMAIILVLPVVQLLILGFAANIDVSRLGMMVVDQDNSATSRKLVRRFTATEYFELNYFSHNPEETKPMITGGKATLALVIPRNFEKNIQKNKPVSVQIIFDGSESYSANAGIGYARIIVVKFAQTILENQAAQSGYLSANPVLSGPAIQASVQTTSGINVEPRVWFNPELSSRKFLIPGIMAMLLMMVTILLTSIAIVKEKELGTLEQLIVTPIHPFQLIVGKLTPFFVVGIIDLTLILIISTVVFGITMTGNIILFYALTMVFLITILGLGFLVSTLSANQQQAMMTSIFFFILPMILLAGFVFPIENMPQVIQNITWLLPLRYYFVIIRGIFLKGSGFAELWDETVALGIFSLVIYTLAILRFRKRLD